VVPGNCDDTYLGQLEAFGLLTALLFLGQYLQLHPHPQAMKQYTLTAYCDNGGTITQATKHATTNNLYPNTTNSDNFDVYNKIVQAVHNLPQFDIKFVHVKGHQNYAGKNCNLTLPERLNVKCNERANSFIPHA